MVFGFQVPDLLLSVVDGTTMVGSLMEEVHNALVTADVKVKIVAAVEKRMSVVAVQLLTWCDAVAAQCGIFAARMVGSFAV